MHRIGDRLLVKVRLTSDNEIVVITFAFRQEKEAQVARQTATGARGSRHFSPFSKAISPWDRIPRQASRGESRARAGSLTGEGG